MGGTKKKSITQAEKAQFATSKPQEKRAREAKQAQSIKRTMAIPRMDEDQMIRVLGTIKAITALGLARALGVNASLATALLRSLEAKAIVKKVGGYSGHYVYGLAPG